MKPISARMLTRDITVPGLGFPFTGMAPHTDRRLTHEGE